MTIKVRFAPSPTGYLHVGNIRTALVNWLFVRKVGGKFVLRIDDTDLERSKPEYEAAIKEDMHWLGLEWDETYKQSERFQNYEAAKQKLINMGRLYPCFESQEELDVKRKFQLSSGKPPIYDRASLKLSEEEKSQLISKGVKPHYRFLLNDAKITWSDYIRGENTFEGRNLSDPILLREDGIPTYTLSSVVDDGELNITHVIRGEDHVSNTAVQIQLFEALFGKAPMFAHLALLKTKDGEISKRLGGFSIRDLRAEGILPLTIHAYLAKLGTSQAIVPVTNIRELIDSQDFKYFGRAAANYDYEELKRLNSKILGGLEFSDVSKSLVALDINGVTESFWNIVRTNIATLEEIKDWLHIVSEQVSPLVEDSDFAKAACEVLPGGNWDEKTWSIWVDAVKQKTDRKGKELFMPLRRAITGRDNGPELAKILPLIGREKVEKRLKGIAA